MIRVKICGLTTLEDALAAAEAGADALGFVLYKESPRCISVAEAQGIVRRLPPFVTTVGLFVNQPTQWVRIMAERCGVDILQFQGDESAAYCEAFGQRAIKAIRVKDRESLADMSEYAVRAFVLDAYREGEYGGTGQTFDWELAVAAKSHGRIILAGGLTPENVAGAVARVRPFGVDVSTGVEGSVKGTKDHGKIRAFIQAAKGA
ncbi:MAG: phosphoribosylanthranilate isomerase [Nitrospiria bacterium]